MTKSRGIITPRHRWTAGELAMLRRKYPHEKTSTLAERMGLRVHVVYQKAFSLGLSKTAKYLASADACRLRRGDNVGAAYRFKPGQIPANKGLRRPGWAPGRMRETQFKKGRRPEEARNYLPIGSHRLSKDGYLERKVTDDQSVVPARRWIAVHRLVWEASNGPIPAGHHVAFLPGRRTAELSGITIDALELVTRAEMMRRNSYHTRLPKELRSIIQLRGAIQRQINKRMRHEKQN